MSQILERPRGNKLGWELMNRRVIPYSKELAVGPYFSSLVISRIRKQQPNNMIITGEPGISKTYTAEQLSRFIQPSIGGQFSVEEQTAYVYSEFMKLMIELPEGYIIILDEPEYVAGHRDWYKDVNKALVSTTRSGRFKVHPLLIPTINKSLLDKVIRKYLLQYMINLDDRGEGVVYKILPSSFDESVFHKPLTLIRVEMLDISTCPKKKQVKIYDKTLNRYITKEVPESWCLNCKDFDTCPLDRAKYERKRKEIQMQRYQEDFDKTKGQEGLSLSPQQLEEKIVKVLDKVSVRRTGRYDHHSLMVVLEDTYGIVLSENKAVALAKRLTIKFPRNQKKEGES